MNKISVAMTTYNGERFLKEQLSSIISQSRQVDELVVCDDGSADNTVNMLNEFSASAPFPVKVAVNEKNLGSTKNFEKAISLCSNDIIILCDQDDVWLPDKVKILEGIFLANPSCAMAFTDAALVDEANSPQGFLWASAGFGKREQRLLTGGRGLNFFIGSNVVTGATAAVAKALFEEARPFPAEFVHDHWLAAEAALKGRLFFSAAVTVNYRRHRSQQLGVSSPRNVFQRAKSAQEFDKSMGLMEAMLKELDGRSHLTAKQRQVFTGKLKFCLFRKNLPQNGLLRAIGIAKTLFLGDYCRYASGFLSAVKDLIRTNPSQNKRL